MYRVLGPLLGLALLGAVASPAAAADCVPLREARDLIQSGAVIPLRAALGAARASVNGDMIDGKLCRGGKGYQYVVTLLGLDGRVLRVTVDARSGDVVGVR
jgi:uncharacterized membrane protein YkoI